MRTQFGEDGKSRVLRPEAEIVALPEGTIPPLIDRLTFERAQARLERNKSELARPTDSTDTLLRGGFVFCGACGRRMVVKRSTHNGRKQVRYICQYRDTCRLHVITADILDSGVWTRVSSILSDPARLRAVLSEPSRDLSGEIAAIDQRVEELRREESGLTRLGAKLEESDDALESVLTELREVKARRRTLEGTRERLQSQLEDEALRVGRIEATIAAVEEASSVPTLDYSGRRQALCDLGVRVAVYPSWHESPYRWVMSAFEMEDGGGRRLWVDGEALNRVSAAASPDALPRQSPTRTRTPHRTGLLYHACGAPSAHAECPGGRAWSAPASDPARVRDAPVRRKRRRDRRSG